MKHFPLIGLHSDILEERYGSISAKVLKHNSKIRESLMVDKKNIARTYALTFLGKMRGEVSLINEEIKKGKPIGKAFRDKGYVIRKNVLEVFTVSLPAWLKKEFASKENKAKARLAEFYAKKDGNSPIIYGIVTEVYSPDFRKPQVNKIDKLQISAFTEYLEKEGFSKDEIWRRIGDENNYEDVEDRFIKARRKSKDKIAALKDKIRKEILSPR